MDFADGNARDGTGFRVPRQILGPEPVQGNFPIKSASSGNKSGEAALPLDSHFGGLS
jgi:hypothetical protein